MTDPDQPPRDSSRGRLAARGALVLALLGLGPWYLSFSGPDLEVGPALAAAIGLRAPAGAAPSAEAPAVAAAPEIRREHRQLAFGSTLGRLLEDVLSPRQRHQMATAMSEYVSPSRLRAGTAITLEYQLAPAGGTRSQVGMQASAHARDVDSLAAVVVELDRDRSLRLEPRPARSVGWVATLHEVPTRTDTFYVSGRIESSLWGAVERHPVLQGRTPQERWLIVDGLDRVYQWQIDFSRQIQPGDAFRLAFEAQVRPDGTLKDGRVLAAEFVNAGTRLTAVWFDARSDGGGDYFDLSGTSVRRAFLKKPLEFRRISSNFNPNRMHPVLGTRRPHRGVDYAAARGTPIMVTGDGVVTHQGPRGGLGNAVIVRHANGYVTRYGHMSRIADGLRVGQRVQQGQTIGYVGQTGLATGPHLHYEMWKGDRALDPLDVELPSGDPVPDAARPRWERELGSRLALLDRTPMRARTLLASTDPDSP